MTRSILKATGLGVTIMALGACAHYDDPPAYYDYYQDSPTNYEEPRCDRVYDDRRCEQYYERKDKKTVSR
ncbi:hypothetical protein [Asticcacaulis sp. YBE204]|uniref:hypothetical protein n=1 Tax=Asticcacaulis sp. YBE204 TaxID=1282363 RepID=UPI0003C3F0BA|nr:hypothetical protein [Asticcacaulis sp. YBE204]ESQ78224.1 hypothetical protein AEYBE204_15415 [Asticcacaulis sp. YBE204]